MKKSILPIICIVFSLLLFSCGKPAPVSKQEIAFGTVCSITLYERNAEKVLDKCFARLQELDDIFNINEEDSDISNINKNAGIAPVKISEEAFYVLQKARLQVGEGAVVCLAPTHLPLAESVNIIPVYYL